LTCLTIIGTSTLCLVVSFFFLLSPPPSPLFPYPTLFRSRHSSSRRINGRPPWTPSGGRCHMDDVEIPRPLLEEYSPSGEEGPAVDRKSTRLNSSHQIISYAVFCLKKKKKKPIMA